MLKKGFALLLLLLAAVAAISQEDPNRLLDRFDRAPKTAEEKVATPPKNPDGEYRFFTIANLTTFTAREIFIRKAGETSWGKNLLDQPLHNRQNISVRLEQLPDLNALYDVRMVDTSGDVFAQYNLTIREGTVIRLERGNFEYNK